MARNINVSLHLWSYEDLKLYILLDKNKKACKRLYTPVLVMPDTQNQSQRNAHSNFNDIIDAVDTDLDS